MRISKKYADRAKRDEEFKALKGAGIAVTRRTARNQSFSPDFLEDRDTCDAPKVPNGFGGHSPTFFAAIYIIEEI